MYKTILIKFSGEVFASQDNNRIVDLAKVVKLAKEILKLQKKGIKIGVMLGGGNIFRGRWIENNEIEMQTGHQMGMLAGVINGMALHSALEGIGCPAELISNLAVSDIVEKKTEQEYQEAIDSNKVLVFVGGLRPGVSHDTGAVQRGIEMNAEVVLKATKVNGVYDKDPVEFSDAKKYDKLSFTEAVEKKLGIMDVEAYQSAEENNLQIRVFKFEENSLEKAINSEIGSLIVK